MQLAIRDSVPLSYRPKKIRSELLEFLGVQFPGPFFAGNCAEKHMLWVPIRRGGSEDFHRKRWKIADNRTLRDIEGRYFGGDVQFSAANRR